MRIAFKRMKKSQDPDANLTLAMPLDVLSVKQVGRQGLRKEPLLQLRIAVWQQVEFFPVVTRRPHTNRFKTLNFDFS